MPFAVFRRHEKKLMAVFAIMAMFAFVVSDSLFGLFRSGAAGQRGDTPVVELYGKTVRQSDLARLRAERSLANAFVANLAQHLVDRDAVARAKGRAQGRYAT